MKRNLLILLAIVGTLACGIDIDLDDSSERDPCDAMCLAQASASCASFSMNRCQSACRSLYAATPRCEAELDAAMRCASRSTYTCTDGRPTITSCVAELDATGRCLNAQER
jgi:hypothetical protein